MVTNTIDPARILAHRGLKAYIRKRLNRMLSSKVDVDDILQNVCIACLGKEFDGSDAILYHIAKAEIISASKVYGAEKRDWRRETKNDDGRGSSFVQSDQLEIAEEIERVFGSLEKLDKVSQQTIQMRYAGMTNKEISEFFETDEASASMRYRRAIMKLRRKLCVV